MEASLDMGMEREMELTFSLPYLFPFQYQLPNPSLSPFTIFILIL